jgi:AbiU2
VDELTQPIDHDFFKSVVADVSHLHMYWKVYRQLYARSAQRIELLNETGSMVFHILKRLLLDEVTLSICRLTDPAMTGKKENHSLARLVASVQEKNLSEKLESILNAIQQLAKPFRDRRNRGIAHSDLETKLKLETNPLPGISREMVEKTLEQIRTLMNVYDNYYFKNTTAYEAVILALGSDGDFLCEQLRLATAFRELERKGEVSRALWTEGRYKDA